MVRGSQHEFSRRNRRHSLCRVKRPAAGEAGTKVFRRRAAGRRLPHNVGMRRGVAWLFAELPQLVERRVLTPEAADALRRHYGPPDSGPRLGWGQILLASFGALLVGGGIILILAHNWNALGRPARAAIALELLLIAQALTVFAVARRPDSAPWTEATSGLLVVAVGAAIALVGQTYHLGGSFESLMRAWLWLVVLVPYITGSSLAAILFWCLLVVRSLNLGWHQDAPFDPWPLAFVAYPFVLLRLRRAPESWSTALVIIAAVASIFVLGSVSTLDVGWSGLWVVFQVSFLAALVAAASWPPGKDEIEFWRGRVLVPSWLLLIVIGTILTFDETWRPVSIDDRHFRHPNVVISALVAVACAVFASITAIRLARAGRMAAAIAAGAALLVVAMHGLAMLEMVDGWIAFNVWLLAVGVLTLTEGLRGLQLGTANRGLAALAALIITRFFDTDLTFLARGLAFVAFGIACLALNFWLMRRVSRVAA
jgi:uncharacterized membrane protein